MQRGYEFVPLTKKPRARSVIDSEISTLMSRPFVPGNDFKLHKLIREKVEAVTGMKRVLKRPKRLFARSRV